jgi:magnesium transporter
MKKVRHRSGKAGLSPGSFVSVDDSLGASTNIRLFEYGPDRIVERRIATIQEFLAPDPGCTNVWIDIDGLNNGGTIQSIGERYDLHPLLMEDVLNTDHRPKVEEYHDSLFIVAKMLSLDEETGGIHSEQICFVLREGLVISFQERPGDVLEPVRERLRQGMGKMRRARADYLVYALLDVIVDHYFLIVEALGQRIEALERKVMLKPGNEDLLTIQELRSLLIGVNRFVMPTRELAGRLNTLQNPLIDKGTRRYINDLQDHTVYIAETITTDREILASLENTYHAGQNARMAQVMKLLTVISTIFIPLTFVVGVYGMNFDHMPELRWHYGYFLVMGVMLVIAVAMLIWFRRKRWI